jgi:hypothetical protein
MRNVNIHSLNNVEIWEQYQVKIQQRTFENLFDAGDTGRAWENVENTKSQLKIVNIILNWSGLNLGFMQDIQNF